MSALEHFSLAEQTTRLALESAVSARASVTEGRLTLLEHDHGTAIVVTLVTGQVVLDIALLAL